MYSIKRTSTFLRYGVAILVVGVAMGIKVLLDPVIPQDVPFLLLFGAVMVSAWYGGLRPGLLTMVLAGLATYFLFLRPQDPFALGAIPLLVFFVEGTLVCLLTEALRASRRRAEASKAEAERDHERLRRSEERLRESEALYRNVVEQVAENIFLLDPDTGFIIQANTSLVRSLGYEADELR
jgi:K+-sensing histidine kinase KdpD